MSRLDFIKIEFLRVTIMVILTIALPISYFYWDEGATTLIAFLACMFWFPFVMFMLMSDEGRDKAIDQLYGKRKY